MIEYTKTILANQFDASLAMLDACLVACPTEHWRGPIGNCEFWHVAYHTLHYTDLYLSSDEASFTPPSFFRPNSQFLDRVPWPPHEKVAPGKPFERALIRQYLSDCRTKASETVAAETQESLTAPSGFPWYPMSRGEHHLCSIRHVQHHSGQLSAYLRENTDHAVNWIGKVGAPEL